MKAYTLYELNNLLKEAIEGAMPDEYWVQAELSECYERGGHCYLELVEKNDNTNTFIAKARAVVWSNVWKILKQSFENTTGQRLSKGMKVMLQVYPNFHAAFGFSWIVNDMDPTYTIGDMVQRRQRIIKQLKDDGVFDLNKQLTLPLFCQRIAVISSASAAGYGDFCNQLLSNSFGFHFHTELFEAIMQGDMVEQTIIAALDEIYKREKEFDCVVIIRGGGASSDLAGFDTYNLATNAAQFSLPIITGIGHERDDTILDMVAHTRVKTPTAAAEFLINNLCEIDSYLVYASQILQKAGRQAVRMAEQKLLTHNIKLKEAVKIFFERKQHKLEMIGQRLESLDPTILLKRGYSITTLNGKIVKGVEQVKNGDEIETILRNGKIKSKVEFKKKS